MPVKDLALDKSKFINPAQIGGIEAYTLDEGPARGARALCVNTGGGLRYRILVDRGLDIDQAFIHQHSLSFLTYNGVTPPTRALDRGLDWLKSFPGGLLTSCGPFGMGAPCTDNGEECGLHGPHSNTAASIESIVQPDPQRGQMDMIVVGRVRYGAFYGPCAELKRTLRSPLGGNAIHITDEFYNAHNQPVPHGYLLHINFGYPLCDAGSEICAALERVEAQAGSESTAARYANNKWRVIPEALKEHSGSTSWVGYLFPTVDKLGLATAGIVNRKLGIAASVRYSPREFCRLVNWQHWGSGEYVTALEPATGVVEGRDKNRALGLLQQWKPGEVKRYTYTIAAHTDKEDLAALRALNG
jgi:hypothetical protein